MGRFLVKMPTQIFGASKLFVTNLKIVYRLSEAARIMTLKAFAYLRTSSATNVGADKDSDKRQRCAIFTYAKAHRVEIVGEYYDADVKGADPVTARPAFAEMLTAIAGNGVRMIIVESASRFARDLLVQETGCVCLRGHGITLIAADDPDAFTADTPTAIMVRQILGAVAQFEKANLVVKLRAARDRKRAATGRCEGRKPVPAEAQALARRLQKKGLSLRDIAAELAAKGFLSPSGKPYVAQSVKVMIKAAARK
jgi:DNA invertase Pin-like site-specific DNA recombinase